jgi:hypothetical protein
VLRRRRLLALPLVIAGLVGALVLMPRAEAGQLQVSLEGNVDCILDEGGFQLVEWTLTNDLGIQIAIISAVVDDSGLTTGSAIDNNVTFAPNPLAGGGATATGFGSVTGDATGDLHLIVTYSFDGTFTVDGEVVMPGGCVQPTTTTTEATTSTTAATTTTLPEAGGAGAVPIPPNFTG